VQVSRDAGIRVENGQQAQRHVHEHLAAYRSLAACCLEARRLKASHLVALGHMKRGRLNLRRPPAFRQLDPPCLRHEARCQLMKWHRVEFTSPAPKPGLNWAGNPASDLSAPA